MVDTLRPRPAILRALGKTEPPTKVQTDGHLWTLQEVFKHDSWAATARYAAGDQQIVVKFNRWEPIFLVPMVWLGCWLASREARAYELLKDVPGVPAACGQVKVGGRVFFNAFAHHFVEGHPLARGERPGEEFFAALAEILRVIHRQGLAYLDLNKRENVIVTDVGRPLLVDFQIHLALPAWLAGLPPGKWFLHMLQDADRYHLEKLRVFHTRGSDAVAAIRVPWSSRLWRWIYVHPLHWTRRRLLVALRIRKGEGLAMSELEPEKSVRLERENLAAPRPDAPEGVRNQDSR